MSSNRSRRGTSHALPWHSQEFQAALSRFALGFVALVFLVVADATGSLAIDWTMVASLYGLHLIVFVAIFAWVLARPTFERLRSDLALLTDLSAITSIIYLAGDALVPLYLIYVVLFLSQGTRFGQRNLMLAASGSVVCYTGIAGFMGAWQSAPVEAALVVVTLVLLPFYQHILLANLQRARRNAEAAKEARGQFLRTMTHELRTPLSGIVGMTRVLERTPLSREQSRYAASISASANTLHALVGDILDLSKVDAGTLDLADEWLDLREAVAEVCHNLGPQALAKEVELVCRIDGRVPQWVRGDPVRFQQILYNLAGNAVKFTERGRVSVEADRVAASREIGGERIRIVVGDTGKGIPADRVGYVFDPYWQADTAIVGQYGGSGLGTTIAYRLVSAMGGDIDVDSAQGEGTVFRLTLPLLSGDPDDDAPPQPPPELSGRVVALVEADERAREAMAESCRQAAMVVHEFDHSAAFVPNADVVVVADTPGGGDPAYALADVRTRAEERVPVVYVGYRGRPLPDGLDADASVAKPFQPFELWQALALAVHPARGPQAQAAAARIPSSGASRVLVAEDDVVNAELIQTVLERAGYDVVWVTDGNAVLDALHSAAFDLVLLDLRMPGMSGAELAGRIRCGEAGAPDIPLVALSADASEGTQAESLAAGIDEHLSKPIDPDRLDDIWRRLVLA
ncbi:MAG: hypothetical protein BRD57_04165 [Proteobacteria bacterium SW_6_67_9]|nr:MAG: hypothetical protein BRD57_04165 [Proteobacteria bacterium SW_6_67_9]